MKLHPLSVPYRTVQQLGRVAFLVFLAFFGTTAGNGAAAVVTVVVVAVVALAAILAWQVAYYRRFDYEITDDTFDIRSGVVSRRNREIPIRRVQNVDVTESVVQRVLGLALVNLETAGGSASEASLRYVDKEEAERIRNEVRRRKRILDEGIDDVSHAPLVADEPRPATLDEIREAYAEDEEDEQELLYEISANELLLLSTFSIDFRLVAFALFLLSFLPPEQFEILEGVGNVFSGAVVPVVVLGLVVVIVLWVIGFATSFSRYYGFVLTRIDDTLGYERGLFSRFSGSIPVDKVQTFTLYENVLKRYFDYSTLAVDTAGYSPTQARQQGSETAVPLAKHDRVMSLAREIDDVETPEFERPPKRARRRYGFRYTLVLAAVTTLLYAATFADIRPVPWYAPLSLLLLVPFAAHYKWKNRGYYLGDEYVATRNGFWNRTVVIVPYYRVQNVIESSTVFQRRWRLATVTVDTAGSSGFRNNEAKAIDIGFEDAERVRSAVRERLQESLVRRRAERKGQET